MSCLLWHDWEFSIREVINSSNASSGEITYFPLRYCCSSGCNKAQLYVNHEWVEDRTFDTYKTLSLDSKGLIDYLVSSLKKDKIDVDRKIHFEGGDKRFYFRSPIDGNVLCEVDIDILKTGKFTYLDYTRYRIFDFDFSGSKVSKKEAAATFYWYEVYNQILFRIRKDQKSRDTKERQLKELT